MAAPVVESTSGHTNNDFSGTQTIVKPTGTQEGDLLFVIFGLGDPTLPTVSYPSGWVSLISQIDGKADDEASRLAIGYKVAGNDEPSDYTFNFSELTRSVSEMFRVSGANATNPISASASVAGGSNTSHNAPSISPSVDDCLLLCAAATRTNRSLTSPSGMDEIWNGTPDSPMANLWRADAAIASEPLLSNGATGTRTFTTPFSDYTALASIAVAPAEGGEPEPDDIDASGEGTTPGTDASGTAGQTNTATGAATTPSATASGTAEASQPDVGASGAVTTPPATATGAASQSIGATGEGQAPSVVASGATATSINGAANLTTAPATAAGIANLAIAATGAGAVPTATADATAAQTVTATGESTAPAVTASGSSEGAPVSADGSPAITPVTATGEAAQVFTATGEATTPATTAFGTSGAAPVTATGEATTPATSASGAATQTISATGEATTPAATASGAASAGAIVADGEATAPAATASGAAVIVMHGAGEAEAPRATATGVVLQVVTADAPTLTPAATVFGIATIAMSAFGTGTTPVTTVQGFTAGLSTRRFAFPGQSRTGGALSPSIRTGTIQRG